MWLEESRIISGGLVSEAEARKSLTMARCQRPTGTELVDPTELSPLVRLVREAGLEPARLLKHRILSPGRLPIPPLPPPTIFGNGSHAPQ